MGTRSDFSHSNTPYSETPQREMLPGGGAMLLCYVDDRTLSILTEYSQRTGRTVENLAEAAISDEAIRSVHPTAR